MKRSATQRSFRALSLAALLAVGGCATSSAEPAEPPLPGATMPQQHHTIDYIEFGVQDMTAAQQFYAVAFGWKFTDYGPEYAGIQRNGGGEVGGLRLAANVTRGGPLVILYSDNLEASVDAVQAAGGAIVQPIFPFPGGRRFHFTDPSGNELAVWSDT